MGVGRARRSQAVCVSAEPLLSVACAGAGGEVGRMSALAPTREEGSVLCTCLSASQV